MGDVPAGREADIFPAADTALVQQFNKHRAGVVAIEAQLKRLADTVQRKVMRTTAVRTIDKRTLMATIRHYTPA
jgi:hypothetical protein